MINPVNAISIRYGGASMINGPAGASVMRYFDMWNTGDTAIADQILHPDWVDHAHPEVTGPAAVKRPCRPSEPPVRTCISPSTPSWAAAHQPVHDQGDCARRSGSVALSVVTLRDVSRGGCGVVEG
jgi:hypothetical protein